MSPIPTYTRRSTSRPAFTLIELLIVIVVVGILLGVSLPRIGRTINKDRVQRSALVVQTMLDEAGQFAARLRVPVNVRYVSSSGSIVVTNRTTGTVLRSRTFGANQDLRATVAFNPTTGITIFPNGRADGGIRITLSTDGFSTVVSRTATGILRRE